MSEEKNEELTSENNEDLEKKEEETEETEGNTEETEEETSEEESDNEPSLEDYRELQAKYKNLEDKNKQLFARLKKEQPNKLTEKNVEKSENDFEEAMDVRFLKRDGFTDEDISKLKVIRDGYKSSGKTISLIEASNDELFKAVMEKKGLEEKRKNSQLGSSSGTKMFSDKPLSDKEFEKQRQQKAKEALREMGFN